MALDSRWVKGFSEKERKEFLQLLDFNTRIFDKLSEILDEEEKSLLDADNSIKEYENPNWQYLKADRAGAIRTIRNIKKLITKD